MDPRRDRQLLTLTQRPALGSLVHRDLHHAFRILSHFQISFHTYSALHTIPPCSPRVPLSLFSAMTMNDVRTIVVSYQGRAGFVPFELEGPMTLGPSSPVVVKIGALDCETRQDAPSCPVVFNDAVSSPTPVMLMDIASRKDPTWTFNCVEKMFAMSSAISVPTVFQRVKSARFLNSKNG
jgi:hypothetical protein